MSLFKRRKKSSPSPVSVAGIPDEVVATNDFDVVVRQLIRQMAPPGDEIVEAGDDSLRVGSTTTYLGNLRKGWEQRKAGEREVWLRDAVHGLFLAQLRDSSTLDTTMLRPGIRAEWYLNLGPLMYAAQRGVEPSRHDVAYRQLGEGLVRVLLWDTPTTMSLITNQQITEWGADFDQLWAIALQNLAAEPTTDGWARIGDGCWRPIHSDDYTAERVFIDGYLAPTQLEGEMVMFHPNRTTLLLADPADPASVAIAAQMALERANDANPVTLMPYIGRGLSWRPLELPDQHPAATAVSRLRLGELNGAYSQQKELLSAIHGEDLFIGTYQMFELDGRLETVASWTETVDTLLPKTDLISFVFNLDAEKPSMILVPWDAAAAIVGPRLEPTAHWPERWRVTTFPDAGELAQLAAAQQR